jgi:hypothetical protein
MPAPGMIDAHESKDGRSFVSAMLLLFSLLNAFKIV